MNVKEIKVQSQLHISREINLQYALRFINEAINELAIEYDTACKRKFLDIEAIEDTWIDLPQNFLTIIRCLDSYDNKFYDFKVEYGQIKFPYSDKFNIAYLEYPQSCSTETETLDINTAYHYAISLFVAAREKQRLFGNEDTDYVRLMQEYKEKAFKANIRLMRGKKTRRRMKSPRWE